MKQKIYNFLNNQKFYFWITKSDIFILFIINLLMILSAEIIICLTTNNKFPNVIEDLIFCTFKTIAFVAVIFFICFLSKKIDKFLIYIFTIYSSIVFLTNIFLFIFYNTFMNETMLDFIFHTNLKEAKEFIIFYLNYKIFIFLFAFITILTIAIIKSNLIKIKQNKSKRFTILFNCLLIIFLITTFNSIVIKKNFQKNEFVIGQFVYQFYNYFYKTKQEISKFSKNLQEIQEKEGNLTANNKIKNIVLIIGESAQRKYHEIYGSVYKNNPNLKKLNPIIFSDMIAPSTGTNPVMREILFFHKFEPFNKNLNIISLYNLAGYDTFWLSNQDIGPFGNVAASVSAVSKNSFQSNTNRYSEKIINLDEVLLKPLKNFKKQSKNNNFFVLHLIGSHLIYNYRYPKNFEVFKAENIKDNLNIKQKEIKAMYLNTIAYTDFFINEVYKIFKNDEALIIYLSDHGDCVYDTGNFAGHARDLKCCVEIPFLMIPTQKFINNQKEILEKIKKAKDLPLTSKYLAYVLSEISQINSSYFDKNLSFLNENYDINQTRFIKSLEKGYILKNYEKLP